MDEVTEGRPPQRSNAADLDTPLNDLAAPAPSEDSFEDEDGAILGFLHRIFAEDGVNQDTAQSDSAFFGMLPREIRDQVYREVSAHDAHCFNFEAMSELLYRVKYRRRAGHSDVLPNSPLRVFAISKQFYEEAVEEWMRERTIKVRNQYHLSIHGVIAEQCGVLKEHIIRLEADWREATRAGNFEMGTMGLLKCCKRLHSLILHVNEQIFDVFVTGLACDTEFTEADYASLGQVQEIISVTSLKEVILIPEISELAHHETEIAQWTRNVLNLQQYIQGHIDTRRQKKDLKIAPSDANSAEGGIVDVEEAVRYAIQPEQSQKIPCASEPGERSTNNDKSSGLHVSEIFSPLLREHDGQQDSKQAHEEATSSQQHADDDRPSDGQGCSSLTQPGESEDSSMPRLHGAGEANATRAIRVFEESVCNDSVSEHSVSQDGPANIDNDGTHRYKTVDGLTWIRLFDRLLDIFAQRPGELSCIAVLVLSMTMLFSITILGLLVQVLSMLLDTLFPVPYWVILVLVLLAGRLRW